MHSRRELLAGAAALGAAAAAPRLALAAAPSGEAAKMYAFFDKTMEETFRRSPELASSLGLDKDANAHSSTFGAGDYVNLPAKMQHEASTKGGAVVQINAMGPFEITYVDPKDDPRKAAPAAK